jgi:acyl-coenzyme A thioesterase PaaI-like protein
MAEPETVGTKVHPGERNFAADLDLAITLVAKDRALLRAPLTPAVTSAAGSARLGVLVTLADIAASDPALASCLPDWTATQDLNLHAALPLVDGPVVVDARLLRLGRKVVVVSVDVFDGHGVEDLRQLQAAIDGHERSALAARGLVVFARLPGTAAHGVDDHDPNQWLGQVRHHQHGEPIADAYDEMGFEVLDSVAGIVQLERTPYVANSIGTINGGAQAMLAEVAAEAVLPHLVATDVQLHYLAQMRAGPARTTATVMRATAGHAVVDVSIVDAGDGGRLLTLATVTLQPAASLRSQRAKE